MSTPSSTIKICSGVRLNNSYAHTIYFDSLVSQLDYFSAKVVKAFADYTYLRKNWEIKVQATMKQAKNWTYLFFNNGDKNYFYFINNIDYVNDNTVKLFIELDVMQTYMFDYTRLQCFVEREHVSNDAIGKHTLDEAVELGELVTNLQHKIVLNGANQETMCVLILTTALLTKGMLQDEANNYSTSFGGKFMNKFSGLSIFMIDLDDVSTLSKILNRHANLTEEIFSMWMYPKSLVNYTPNDEDVFKSVTGVKSYSESLARNKSIDGYIPKNNKLFTFPYNFLYCSNNSGVCGKFLYERFNNPDECEFNISGDISPDSGMMLYPVNYNGVINNFEESLTTQPFPTCAWNADPYKLWLAQNQNQLAHNNTMSGFTIAGGVASTVGGLASGNIPLIVGGVGALATGINQIQSAIAQQKDLDAQPLQARGNHSSSINFTHGNNTFTFQKKSVDRVHAKIIDDYFSMYGYKRNTVKVPFIHVRENWTYTKTIGCHVKGDLCTEDLRKIESIFDNGITFWANGDSIGDYSLSNNTL